MTMRAPPLASMAAVAAPRPDAEPVTIAHKPSFDIRISSCGWPVERHHIVPQNACKSPKLRCAELMMAAAAPFMSALQGTCGHRRLSRQWLFTIMRCKKRPQPMLGRVARPDCAIEKTGNAVAESENIVAETAEKIF